MHMGAEYAFLVAAYVNIQSPFICQQRYILFKNFFDAVLQNRTAINESFITETLYQNSFEFSHDKEV